MWSTNFPTAGHQQVIIRQLPHISKTGQLNIKKTKTCDVSPHPWSLFAILDWGAGRRTGPSGRSVLWTGFGPLVAVEGETCVPFLQELSGFLDGSLARVATGFWWVVGWWCAWPSAVSGSNWGSVFALASCGRVGGVVNHTL